MCGIVCLANWFEATSIGDTDWILYAGWYKNDTKESA